MNFDFITDSRFKALLLDDYQELKICFENKSSKAVLILSGSIIEAVLVEYFLQNLPTNKTQEDLLKMTLGALINLAETEGLLTETEKNLASVIQDYRNLIHPGRQIRKNENYNFDTANIAKNLVKIIIKAISQKQQAATTYTANEIINKLKIDWSFRTIYKKAILNLKQSEQNKLFDLLFLYEIENKERWNVFEIDISIYPHYDDPIYQIKPLITELKPHLEEEFILKKLRDLINEIQKGHPLMAFALFNFIHEDIDKLPDEEQELIAIYSLSTFSNVIEKCSELSFEKTYSTIGKYIKTIDALQAFNEFTEFCIVHFDKASISYEMDVYEQAFNSLQDVQKEEVRLAANSFIFKSGHPPTNIMEGFVESAIKRGILTKPV